MTEQETIDELKKHKEVMEVTLLMKASREKDYQYPAVLEALEKSIEALEKQMNDRWIPVTEKLPECEYGYESTEILFQYKDSGTIETGYFGIGGKIREKYFRHYRSTNEGCDASSVIAWKPLPEPYKED